MEIAHQMRKVSILFIVAVVIASMVYSCSSQRGYAGPILQSNRADTDSIKRANVVLPGVSKPARVLTPLQKQIQQDIPDVLTRSKKAFQEISDIKGMLNYINDNSIAERDLFLARATELKQINDVLRNNQLASQESINKLLDLVIEAKSARMISDKKDDDYRKESEANAKALNLYTSIGMSILISLIVIALLQWWAMKRIKAKYNQLQHG